MRQYGRRLWGEDTSIEAERLRPNDTATKAVRKGRACGRAWPFLLESNHAGLSCGIRKPNYQLDRPADRQSHSNVFHLRKEIAFIQEYA
jgi:hypothetical protein